MNRKSREISYEFGPFILTTRPLDLTRDGESAGLRHKGLKLLVLLIENAGSLVEHDEIRRHLWGERYVDFSRGTHLLVREIREALDDDAGKPLYIETLPRQGYRFLADVNPVPAAAGSKRLRRRVVPISVAAAVVILAAVWGAASFLAAPRIDDESTAAYAKARHLLDSGDPEDVARAAAYFNEVLDRDPASADSLAGLAKIARLRSDFSLSESNARAALSVDPDNSLALLELGLIAAMRDWNWAAAERYLTSAIASSPDSAEAYSAYAAVLTVAGRHDEALEASDRAYRADPVSALIRVDHGWFHYYARDYESAWRICTEAMNLGSGNAPALQCRYKAASMAKDENRQLEAAKQLAESLSDSPALSSAVDSLDDFNAWRGRRIERLRTGDQASAEAFAAAYAEIGDIESALSMLEQALGTRSPALPLVLRDPVFDPVRNTARFRALTRKALDGSTETA